MVTRLDHSMPQQTISFYTHRGPRPIKKRKRDRVRVRQKQWHCACRVELLLVRATPALLGHSTPRQSKLKLRRDQHSTPCLALELPKMHTGTGTDMTEGNVDITLAWLSHSLDGSIVIPTRTYDPTRCLRPLTCFVRATFRHAPQSLNHARRTSIPANFPCEQGPSSAPPRPSSRNHAALL